MTKYIDKAAIVAELEDWRDKIKKGIFSIPLSGSDRAYATFEYEVLGKVLLLLDTFEVKEVDLEREVHKFIDKEELHLRLWDVDRIAKHFFELGLKAKE